MWKLRDLKNRFVRRFRIRRLIWHAEIISLLDDLQQWKYSRPRSRLRMKIISVSDKNFVRVK
ncbi:MAG: hypothetical protein ABIA62_08180 [Candidatus Woesearchaeota archaeon]